jgi:hypothetical protein
VAELACKEKFDLRWQFGQKTAGSATKARPGTSTLDDVARGPRLVNYRNLVSQLTVGPRRAVTGMDNRAYSSLAEQQYDAIRALRRSDIDTVAQNTGLSVADVTTMKKHLFFGKHERFAPEVGKVICSRPN